MYVSFESRIESKSPSFKSKIFKSLFISFKKYWNSPGTIDIRKRGSERENE